MPLHPILVHFPITLLIIGAVVQIIALWKPHFFDKAANYLFVGGFIAGVIAYITGDGAEEYAEQNADLLPNATRDAIHTHENLALISLVIFGAVIALKVLSYYKPNAKLIPWVATVLSIAGAIVIGVAAHYGGALVYGG